MINMSSSSIMEDGNVDTLGPYPYCYLCDKEELPTSPTEDELVYPSCCLNRNAGCRTCLLQWLYACGKNRRYYTCPFCRSPPNNFLNDTLKIFDVDELTWSFIQRQDYGFCCDCGYCTFGPNLVGASQMCQICLDMPVKDRYGRVNIRYTIRRTKVRQERQKMRDQNHQECMDHNSYYRNASAWIFLPDGAAQTLNQLSLQEERKQRRIQVIKECWERTLHAAWLFLPTGADVRAMQHLVMKDDIEVRTKRLRRKMELERQRKEQERQRQELERWIIRCQEEWRMQERKRKQEEVERKKRFALLQERRRSNFLFYQQQQEWKQRISMGIRRKEVRREREERHNQNQKINNDQMSSWLFLHSGSYVKAMNKLVVRTDVRGIRKNKRHEFELEYEAHNNIYAMFPGEYCECCGKRTCQWDRTDYNYSISSWEMAQYDCYEREEAYLQKNAWLECMTNKWMGERGQPAKKSRGGRKSSKSTSGTNKSTAKPNARWKRKQGSFAWSQDESTFRLSSVSYPRSILC